MVDPESQDDLEDAEETSPANVTTGLDEYAWRIGCKLRRNWDFFVGITGTKSSGKSTLAQQLAKRINPEHYSIADHVLTVPTVEAFENAFYKLPKYTAFIIDEAAWSSYKRNFMKPLQIYINQLFMTQRKQNKCVILCMSDFTDFDPYLRRDGLNNWIHIIERGLGIVFKKSKNMFSSDPWRRKINEKTIDAYMGKRSEVTFTRRDVLAACSKTKNFSMLIEFPPLEKEEEQEYLAQVFKAKDEFARLRKEFISGREQKYYQSLIKLLAWAHSQKITQADLSKITSIPLSTVNKMLERAKARKVDEFAVPELKQNDR